MLNKLRVMLIKPEIVFLILGLLAGIPLSIFVPYGAGFDEESHVIRIYDMARGNLIPNRKDDKGVAFIEFYSLSYKRRYLQTPANNMFEPEYFLLKADKANATDATNHSTYSPVVFMVEAVIAHIGWVRLNLPILPVIILMRIAGLCLFLLLGLFTIRMIPSGKWLMTILLLAPMNMYQAATLNGDRFTIAAAFFFIAAVLKVFAKKDDAINLKDTLLVILGTVLVGVSKSGTIVMLPLLLLLAGKRFGKKSYIWMIVAGVVLSFAYSISWSILAVLGTKVQATGTTRAYQMELILQNLPDFFRIYFIGIFNLIPRYYTDWAAEYGYWMGTVPWPVYVLFPISLLVAYFADGKADFMTKKARWITLLVGLLCLGLMASVKFVFAYVPGQLYYGAQGRYFLPFAPMVFLAFIGLLEIAPKWRVTAMIASIVFILAALGIYGYGAYRTYYTTCVYAVDSDHPCTLPVYRNLDTKNPVNVDLKAGTLITQSFDPECSPINSIDLYILNIQGDPQGTITLTFYDKNKNVIGQSDVAINKLKSGQQKRFTFPSATVKGSNEYSFSLELSQDSPATITFWGVEEDRYGKGELLVNGQPSPIAADLYLQFECPR
ncbi:MAG: DUF2142 domain-containing protein [Anaerolineaceae bacterium]|nr:DUF2142 domain-containing protein [Anaerolineaceae bacterium]